MLDVNPSMVPQVGRQVLNAGMDVKNIVSRDEFRAIAKVLLSQLSDLLTPFCGPFSRNALVIAPQSLNGSRLNATGTAIDTKVFTKDGISILNGIEYMSPIETYLKSMLAYIGDRVDSVCKDGTTTSILFAAQFLRVLLELIDKSATAVKLTPTRVMEQKYHELVDMLLQTCEQQKHTVETIQAMLGEDAIREDAVGVIAWMQAYTSSGGDQELADAVQLLFRYLPSDEWRHAEFRRQACETSKRYDTLVEEWDYQLKGQIMNLELLNHDNKRSYLQEAADLLVVPEKIYNGYGFELRIQEYLHSATRPIVMLCPDIDGETKNSLDLLARGLNKHLCILVHRNMTMHQSVLGNIDWDLKAICAMAGIVPYTLENTGSIEAKHLIPNVKVLLQGNEINLYRLYDNPDQRPMHPGVYRPEQYPIYTEFLAELKKSTDFVAGLHTQKNPDELEWMRGVYISARQAKKAVLLIGGRSHDQLASVDVIRDALGATITTLNHGFYVNGPLVLAHALQKLPWGDLKLVDRKISTIYIQAMREAIACVIDATRYTPDTKEYLLLQIDEDQPRMNSFSDLTTLKIGTLSTYVQAIHHGGERKKQVVESCGCPPMQVGMLFEELLNRIGEVLIRFGGTETIIVPGTAWRKE